MRCLCGLAVGLLLSTGGHATPHGRPAVIVAPSPASRNELGLLLGRALGGTAPLFADDALTTSSVLTLEHGRARDPSRLPLNGRDLSRPDVFALYLHGSRCKLVQMKTGKSWTLHHTQCRAAPPAP